MDLPRSARDLCRFPIHEAIAYDGLMALFGLTGRWRYPVRASGDLEEMRFLDKVYWLYKSAHPVRRAVRGSGLEAFFAGQRPVSWSAPEGFAVSSELRLSAAGDLMVHPYLARSGESLYRDVADLIFGVDVAMANLECVVLSAAVPFEVDMKAGPRLVFDTEAFDVVHGHGERRYEFLATACNHSLDFGEDGVSSTIGALRKRGVAFHGVNEREEDADRATLIDANGVRLGLLSFCFGLNAHRPPAHRPRIVNRVKLNEHPDRIDFGPIEKQLRHCAGAGVDFVVAHLHWGMEHELYPRPEQVETAHRLAEMGVDAIVGHHPHVLQPVEYYRTRRDPTRVVPIYYSLGNLTNPFSAPYLRRSGIARMDLVKGTLADGTVRTYVRRADVHEVDQGIDEARRQVSLRPRKRAD